MLQPENIDRPASDCQPQTSLDRPSRRLIVVLATVVLTYLLLTPHPLAFFGLTSARESSHINELVPDKVQHFAAYAVYAAVLQFCLRSPRRGGTFAPASLAAWHAVTTELLQQFVPDRFPDAGDLAADLLGIAAGIGVVHAAARVRRPQGRPPTTCDESPQPEAVDLAQYLLHRVLQDVDD